MLLGMIRTIGCLLAFIMLVKHSMPYIIRLQEEQNIRFIYKQLHKFKFDLVRMPGCLPNFKGRTYKIFAGCPEKEYFTTIHGFFWWKTMKWPSPKEPVFEPFGMNAF